MMKNLSKSQLRGPSILIWALAPLLVSQLSFATPSICRSALETDAPEKLPAITNSLRYRDLENLESDEAKKIIRQSSQELRAQLKGSKNLSAVRKWIRDLYAAERVVRSDADGLSLVDHGFGKSMELILKAKDGSLKSLFSTKNHERLQSYRLSPNKKFVALSWYSKGSIDDYYIQIVNTETGVVTSAEQVFSGGRASFQWADDLSLLVATQRPNSRLDKILADTGERTLAYDHSWGLSKLKNFIYFSRADKPDLLIDTLTGKESELKLKGADLVGSLSTGELILRGDDEKSNDFYSYKIDSEVLSPILSFKDEVLLETFVSGDKVLLYTEKAAERTLRIYDATKVSESALQEIKIPIEFTLSSADYDLATKLVSINMASPLKANLKTQFKLGVDPNFSLLRKQAMQGKKFVAQSKILHVKTEDGWDLPVRLVFNSKAQMNGKNPVIMPAYGGFNLPGYFEPSYKAEYDQFLQQGGVLAFPIIRGGAELGRAGHEAAQGARKLATSAKDLIAVARALVKAKVTSPKKIIIQGTSNGGRLVATAALMAPESFGMAIAINGVHDLLAKEYLDERNDLGWSSEFGNSTKVEDFSFVDHLSNVEAPFASEVNIFIVGGRNDTRVNPAHSLKLYAALKGQSPEGVKLFSLNNSGHWMESPSYQGLIGWWTETVIWTQIFDYLNFDPQL